MTAPLTGSPLRKSRIFYGWFTLFGVMLIVFSVAGIFSNSFGVFLPVVAADTGWSRGSVALALSLGTLAFGLPSPLFGILTARFGERQLLIWGNLLSAIGLMALAAVNALWQLEVLYVIIGFGAGLGGFVPGASLVANWFVKKRPLALGLFTAAGGLGGFAFPPIATALIEATSWRVAWLILGGLIIVIAVILGGVILIRDRPEDMGLAPDGVTPSPITAVGAAESATPAAVRPTTGLLALFRHRIIWFIGGFTFANAFALGTMMSQQVAFLLDRGWTPIAAASTMSLLFGMSFFGSLAFGMLALRVRIRSLAIIGFVLAFGAMMVLTHTHTVPVVYVYALMLGFGNGLLTTAMPTFIGDHYHGDWYARAIGIVTPFQVIAVSIASFIAGTLYDASGSYTVDFYVVAGLLLFGLLLVALIPRPKRATA